MPRSATSWSGRTAASPSTAPSSSAKSRRPSTGWCPAARGRHRRRQRRRAAPRGLLDLRRPAHARVRRPEPPPARARPGRVPRLRRAARGPAPARGADRRRAPGGGRGPVRGPDRGGEGVRPLRAGGPGAAAALAREMRAEYELIHARGFVLQIDAPDLAMERTRFFQDEPLAGFQRAAEMHVEAINAATASIPRDRIRLHVCWGNYDGPHVHDVPLEAILPILYRARVGGLSIELANPRHAHEYRVFRRHPLPDGMLLLPGVIDSTTNFVEHPEVVADRVVAAAEAVGDRTRVLASVDCGFGTFAGSQLVEESVVWAKLRSLREGADIATKRLWG